MMKQLTYTQYSNLSDEEREKLFQQYCKKNKLDAATEYAVYEFFDTLDKKEKDENMENDNV